VECQQEWGVLRRSLCMLKRNPGFKFCYFSMIFLLPQILESREYAPGPIRSSVRAMSAWGTGAKPSSGILLTRPARYIPAAIGVRRPKKIKTDSILNRIAKPDGTTANTPDSWGENRLKATEKRKTTRPIPVTSRGKLPKILRTSRGYTGEQS
jgi:hypothetical protein